MVVWSCPARWPLKHNFRCPGQTSTKGIFFVCFLICRSFLQRSVSSDRILRAVNNFYIFYKDLRLFLGFRDFFEILGFFPGFFGMFFRDLLAILKLFLETFILDFRNFLGGNFVKTFSALSTPSVNLHP